MRIPALLPLLLDLFFNFFAAFFAILARAFCGLQRFTPFGVALAFAQARALSSIAGAAEES
jgi:hypothetical protein